MNELDDHSPSDPEDFCVVVRAIIASYDPAHIMKIISRFVERCTGESWREVADKLSRIGYWEFEDYQEEKPR